MFVFLFYNKLVLQELNFIIKMDCVYCGLLTDKKDTCKYCSSVVEAFEIFIIQYFPLFSWFKSSPSKIIYFTILAILLVTLHVFQHFYLFKFIFMLQQAVSSLQYINIGAIFLSILLIIYLIFKIYSHHSILFLGCDPHLYLKRSLFLASLFFVLSFRFKIDILLIALVQLIHYYISYYKMYLLVFNVMKKVIHYRI